MRNWWSRRSLRARLTLAATTVIAAAIATAAGLLVWRVHDALIAGLDVTATGQALDVAATTASNNRPTMPASLAPAAAAQVVTQSGRVIVSSPNLAGEPRLFTFVPTSARVSLRTVPATPLGDNDPYRVAAVSSSAPAGTRYVVYVGLPMADVSTSITELTAALALGGPALVAVLAVITWLLVGRALGPVDVLRQQAADITVTDLHERVDVPPTDDELARLANTLNELLARIESSLDQQRQFVADAAHELRSPVAAILAQLEVDQSYAASATDPGAEGVIIEVRRLSLLVDDLLALARLDASPRRAIVPVDLDDVVLAEIGSLRHRTDLILDGSGVTAARVHGDPGLLMRVVRNLLDNAAQYASSRITVLLENSGGDAVLTVADDGPGIPAGQRQQIFERFTRLEDGRSRDAGGVGLGLSIVHQVVTAYEGTVSVEDNHPGARFTIRLPTAS
jgi:signal transduction histidine kinase